jgi:hypothetical protein
VCAVQEANLVEPVRLDVVGDDHSAIRTGKPECRVRPVALDGEETVWLADREEVVVISEEVLELLPPFQRRLARHDSIDERVAEDDAALEPWQKPGIEAPALREIADDFLQPVPVLLDELAGNDRETRIGRVVESSRSCGEKYCEFAGKRSRWGTGRIVRIGLDTDFSRIREHELEVRVRGELEDGVPVGYCVDRAT